MYVYIIIDIIYVCYNRLIYILNNSIHSNILLKSSKKSLGEKGRVEFKEIRTNL